MQSMMGVDCIESIASNLTAAEAMLMGSVCKAWRTALQHAKEFHVFGRAEGRTNTVASPNLSLTQQPLLATRGLRALDSPQGSCSLVCLAGQLQAELGSIGPCPATWLSLDRVTEILSDTLGDEVAGLVKKLADCRTFPRFRPNVPCHPAGEWHGCPPAPGDSSPWGTWSCLLLGMLLAPAAKGIFHLAAVLWTLSAPGARGRAPPISRTQLRELFAATLLLTRHSEACVLCRLQLVPLHDALQHAVQYLEAKECHIALAAMQRNPYLRDSVMPEPVRSLRTSYPLTKEQVDVIQLLALPDRPLPNIVYRVQAFAGSGKTSVLKLLAEAYPHLNFLYTAFNKHVVKDFERLNEPNVTAWTTHMIAREGLGVKAQEKELTRKHVKLYLERSMGDNHVDYKVVPIVRDALHAFCVSADDEITEAYFPSSKRLAVHPRYRHWDFLSLTKGLFWASLDVFDSTVPLVHCVYLKYFVLLGAQIWRAGRRFDAVLLDEAQDVNPVTLQMLLAQPGPKILVGDTQQHIYGFNGCCDTLSPTGPFREGGLTIASSAAAGLPSTQSRPAHANSPVLTNGAAAGAPGTATSLSTAHTSGAGGATGATQAQAGTACAAEQPVVPPRQWPIPPLRDMVAQQYSDGKGLTLSASFRLGPEVAEVARRLLTDCCHVRKPLLGMGDPEAVVFSPKVGNGIVTSYQQLPLLRIIPSSTYALEAECIPVHPQSKIMHLWQRMHAPPLTEPDFWQVTWMAPPPPFASPVLPTFLMQMPGQHRYPRILYLARTNLGMFLAALACAEAGFKFYIDDKRAELLGKVRSIIQLCTTNKAVGGLYEYQDKQGGPTASAAKLRNAVDSHTADMEWTNAAMIYFVWGPETNAMLQRLEDFRVKVPELAFYHISTVHGKKGAEAPYVQLANDFKHLSRPEDRAVPPTDETYLAYVAATRAEKVLLINPDMMWVSEPRDTQTPCATLQLTNASASPGSAQPPSHAVSFPDLRQIDPGAYEEACRNSGTSGQPLSASSPELAVNVRTQGPWLKCCREGCSRPWFRQSMGARISVDLQWPANNTLQLCSVCAGSTVFGDLWGAQ